MTIAAIIGTLTVTMGILVKIIGFPDQVIKIHRRASIEGLSTTFFIMTFLSYVLWTLHGILQGDWVVIIGQGLGVITSGVLVGQIVFYWIRGRGKSSI